MEEIYKYFSITSIIVGLWVLIRYLIQKKIDSYFNKKLENYKQELAIITENAKYDISKKLYDFEAYASKKHAVYPELYRLVFEPWKDLTRFRFRFDIDIMHSKHDLKDRELQHLFYKQVNAIVSKSSAAHDYFRKNELYLSKNTVKAYEIATSTHNIFLRKIIKAFDINRKNDNWRDPSFQLIGLDFFDEDYVKGDDKLELLKETIYKELSYTHSEETEQKRRGPVVVTEPLLDL